MNVLSLFDGISCCRVALERAGHKVDKYYASEIDKYAIMVNQHHYPDTIQLGSVTDWDKWDIDWSSIDIVTGGFPCQARSLAGQQLGDKDPRGQLFWTTLDIVSKVLEHNPNATFLLENVKMKKEFEDYITTHTEKALGKVNKYLINSALVSAQNRRRFYRTNIDGVEQPGDKCIVLKDILEGEVEEKYHIAKGALATYTEKGKPKGLCDEGGKSKCLTKSMHKGYGNDGLSCIEVGNADRISRKYEAGLRVYSDQGKCPSVTTMQGGNREPKVAIDNIRYRKLTPTECERLQTMDDGFTLVPLPPTKSGKVRMMSDSQRYKQLGNGWTVDVVSHIFSYLPPTNQPNE